jgi:hypothetical protein
MMKRIAILLTMACLLMYPQKGQARSYGFMIEAIREYNANPNAETEGRLHAARRKATAIDASIWVVPVMLGLYVFIRIKTGKTKIGSIGIGTLITERPSHTTEHTDHNNGGSAVQGW